MRLARIVPFALVLAIASGCKDDAPPSDPAPASAPAARPVAPQLTGPIPMEDYVEPTVGGARMATGIDIFSNLEKSKDHTTLIAAVRAAGLEDMLKQEKVTFFAPTNAAFQRLPGGSAALTAANARERLVDVISYHIVPGRLDADAMASRVLEGGGTAQLPTANGKSLKATVGNGAAMVVDSRGATARIAIPNVQTANGVVYVIDTVLTP